MYPKWPPHFFFKNSTSLKLVELGVWEGNRVALEILWERDHFLTMLIIVSFSSSVAHNLDYNFSLSVLDSLGIVFVFSSCIFGLLNSLIKCSGGRSR